jgi:hypothetical protein
LTVPRRKPARLSGWILDGMLAIGFLWRCDVDASAIERRADSK